MPPIHRVHISPITSLQILEAKMGATFRHLFDSRPDTMIIIPAAVTSAAISSIGIATLKTGSDQLHKG